VSVVVGPADLGGMFAYEVDQRGSHDIVACAINDCVEDAADMLDSCQSSIKSRRTSCSGRCLNITGINIHFTIITDTQFYIIGVVPGLRRIFSSSKGCRFV